MPDLTAPTPQDCRAASSRPRAAMTLLSAITTRAVSSRLQCRAATVNQTPQLIDKRAENLAGDLGPVAGVVDVHRLGIQMQDFFADLLEVAANDLGHLVVSADHLLVELGQL